MNKEELVGFGDLYHNSLVSSYISYLSKPSNKWHYAGKGNNNQDIYCNGANRDVIMMWHHKDTQGLPTSTIQIIPADKRFTEALLRIGDVGTPELQQKLNKLVDKLNGLPNYAVVMGGGLGHQQQP